MHNEELATHDQKWSIYKPDVNQQLVAQSYLAVCKVKHWITHTATAKLRQAIILHMQPTVIQMMQLLTMITKCMELEQYHLQSCSASLDSRKRKKQKGPFGA